MRSLMKQDSLDEYTAGLSISQVKKINDSMIEVSVNRNANKKGFVGISFLVEDGKSAEVIRKNISKDNFESENFSLNFISLNSSKIEKILITPIFVLKSGQEIIGDNEDAYISPACLPNCPYEAQCGINGCGGECGNGCSKDDLCIEYKCIKKTYSENNNPENNSINFQENKQTSDIEQENQTNTIMNNSNISEENFDVQEELQEKDFIFTYWPVYLPSLTSSSYPATIKAIEDMNNSGMNYAGIYFRPTTNSDGSILELKNKGYKIAQEISSGHYTWGSSLPELFDKTADNGKQFFSAPCLNKTVCENWDKYPSPAYKGVLWKNTLENTKNVTIRAQPDIVLFDIEIWYKPETLEWYFTGGDPDKNCKCYVVREGIGYEEYNSNWRQRGTDLKKIVDENSKNTSVILFYNELPLPEGGWGVNYKGDYIYREINYILDKTGTYPNPSLYVLPNLEVLEKNYESGSLKNTIPWISLEYYTGLTGYNGPELFFDKSVAREAGRILRKGGARGIIFYLNALSLEDKLVEKGYPVGYGYNYWLENAREMVEGFKEGLTYVETNKIKNPGFEALKTKADSYTYVEGKTKLTGDIRYTPIYWMWYDTNSSYNDFSNYTNLSFDNKSGMRSWKHMRYGDIGNRTIFSNNFTVSYNESGNYIFSIYTKSNLDLKNGKISFILKDIKNNTEQLIGEAYFVSSWNKFASNSLNILPGEYSLKIFIEDMTGEISEIYFDDVVLKRG